MTITCKSCGLSKPDNEFHTYNQSTCKVCRREYNSKYRTANKKNLQDYHARPEIKKHREEYRKTSHARGLQMYRGMKERCGKHPRYREVELRISKKDFVEWAVPQIEKFLGEHPNKTPSIDRIQVPGHYEFGNVRILDMKENTLRSRLLTNWMGVTADDPKELRLSTLKKLMVSNCENLGISVDDFIQFVNAITI